MFILYEAGTDKNMSDSILFHWQTFLDCWRGSCQDYFQSCRSIYYRRPLISPSLSDNDSARETTGDLHLNPPLGRVWQPLCIPSWYFMVVSALIEVGCVVEEIANRVSLFRFTACVPLFFYPRFHLLFFLSLSCDNSESSFRLTAPIH